MSDRPLHLTLFAGVTLHNGATIKQITPYEMDGDVAITRQYRLSNGAIFDADGTADGAKTFGKIRATFRITGATHAAAVATLLTLEALLNKRGTLTGVEYGASSGTNRTCNARCAVARPVTRDGMAMAVGRLYQAEIDMVWQRFTGWS